MIGMRIDHTSRDGANTDLRYQFDADACRRIRIFEVMDQLRQILDRIDVVVGWWADQSNPGRRKSNSCNVLIDLATRQFATFARFRPLGHFDLQFISIGQVPDGDTESP